MNSRIYTRSIFALAFGLALMLGACGGASDEAETEANDAPETPAAAESTDGGEETPQAIADAEPESEIVAATDLPAEAPDVFKVLFECSNGNILIECHKEWAPIGAQHFYDLVKAGYYDDARFFRVIPGFMVQFGLAADPEMTSLLGQKNITDDPVTQSNTLGMVTYAKTGAPNSRSTQLFINTGNNARLDRDGFAPFAKVLEGMETVTSINPQYGEQPNQGQITGLGNSYLNANFPNLDYIKSAKIVK